MIDRVYSHLVDSDAHHALMEALRAEDWNEKFLGRSSAHNPSTSVELAAYRGAFLSSLGRHGEAAEALTWVAMTAVRSGRPEHNRDQQVQGRGLAGR
jgi:hypothetical protein